MSSLPNTLSLTALLFASLVVSACGDSDVLPSDADQPLVEEPASDPGVPIPDTSNEASSNDGGNTAAPALDDGAETSGAAAPSENPVPEGEGPEPPNDDNTPAVDAPIVTGADLSGGQDDSPTLTESLSLQGPSIKDETRGAGPPSVPTRLTRLMAGENWVEFTWAPSSDDQAVKAYEIYRDDQLIATVRGDTGYEHDLRSWLSTSFIDCNYTRYANCVEQDLQPQAGASYAYSVAAVDNEGMRSERSEPAVFSMATPGNSVVDLSTYRLVFDEQFNEGKINRDRWKTSLPWGPNDVINNEKQHFVNTFGTSNPVDYDPFVFTDETIRITGIDTPADQLANANNQPFLSGVLTTSDYFEMTYGYVEMRAKLAAGEGMLSTFYLFNQDYYKNKPEIDIVEYLGARPDKAYQTYHYYDSNRARENKGEKHSSPTMETVTDQNMSDDFHTYGVLWEPELIIWYIDGVEVRRVEGVRVSDEPMNIVTQLVMGSEWIGDPDPSAVPAVLEIDYIKAWQK